MKLIFVSNYINHHQIPLSEELLRLTGGDYIFLQTKPMTCERIKMGWDPEALNKPYVRIYDEDREFYDRLLIEAECVIFGGAEDEELIIPRLEKGKFTIRYSERIYKEGRYKFISPRGLKKKYHDHIRFRRSNVYLLCAGAYVAGDFNLILSYPGKKLKFGYFPEFIEYENLHELRSKKERDIENKIEILWVGRFIDLKHPEVIFKLAGKLKERNVNFHISMIGALDKENQFEEELSSYNLTSLDISFLGSMSPEKVREHMRRADVFIVTSDRREGWGAVVNEAMNSGCVVLAPKEIGAAGYLIKDKENGFIYSSCNVKEVLKLLLWVLDNRETSLKMGEKAYESIKKEWNASVAAERLMEFIESRGKEIFKYESGPLSRA